MTLMKDYVKIDDDLTSEIAMDEDILTSKQLEPYNDFGYLEEDFGVLPSVSEFRAALKIMEQFYYTKYENTDIERNALLFFETSVNTKYSTKRSTI